MTRFGRLLDRSAKSLVAEAVDGALLDAECAPDEVELVVLGNVLGGLMQRQESCRGQVWLSESQVSATSVVNVENACASGATALHQAWLAVAGGLTDVALAVGVEKMYQKGGNLHAIEAMTAVVDQDQLEPLVQEHTDAGSTGSLFMGIYARWAREYAARSGATPEDFARVAVKNHDNGARNPKAQHRATYTLQDVLDARPIAEPLTLPMCSPISDGAAALVVTTAERAARWGADTVRLLGTAVGAGRI